MEKGTKYQRDRTFQYYLHILWFKVKIKKLTIVVGIVIIYIFFFIGYR